jgi:hypothetical protein
MVMPDFEETARIMREAGYRKVDGVWRKETIKRVVPKRRRNPRQRADQ